MSQHREFCNAEAPIPLTDRELIKQALTQHRHQCIHEPTDDDQRTVEHKCSCGMTWRATSTRPPPDTSWITFEKPHRTLKALTWVKLAATLVLLGLVFAIAVTLVIR